MRAGIIVSRRGVERAVSIGEGPEGMDACLRLIELIRPELDQFHRGIVAKFAQLRTMDAADALILKRRERSRKRPLASVT
jgi:hypothetical protein